MVVLTLMLAFGLANAFAPTSHAATNQTHVVTAPNGDTPSTQIRVYCKTWPGIMDHVYVSGNNQHNTWSQWWGSSSDGYYATTWNYWWNGLVYIQWRTFGFYENHEYVWVDASHGWPIGQVNVC